MYLEKPVRSTLVLAAAALAAAFAPLPPAAVERWYSRGVYPLLQLVLTPLSSAVPIALLDVAVVMLAITGLTFFIRRWRKSSIGAAFRTAAISIVATGSIVYLVFLALWGLNYRRLPLETKLAYEPSRVTRDATFRFGEAAVERINALATTRGQDPGASRESLELAFRKAQEQLGAGRTAGGAPAKRSMFSWYLRMAGIDGMMNPFFLEIILNPEVLPVERPFALAHEWAHLAGYANESEANFVAWLTCSAADASAQYSGWLEAYRYAIVSLPRDDRRALQQRLTPEVVQDLRAINERLGRADPKVSGLARNVYDSYLRAQGVEEGIASYGAMLRLMVGTTFENGWVPRLRQ
jgi:hypothetical protein